MNRLTDSLTWITLATMLVWTTSLLVLKSKIGGNFIKRLARKSTNLQMIGLISSLGALSIFLIENFILRSKIDAEKVIIANPSSNNELIKSKDIPKKAVVIRGIVANDQRYPIANASISTLNGLEVKSDSNGFFAFAIDQKIAKDSLIRVMIHKDGYVTTFQLVEAAFENDNDLTFFLKRK